MKVGFFSTDEADGTRQPTQLPSSGTRDRPKVVLVDPDEASRAALLAELMGVGIEVAAFGDPEVAFFFLLGRFDEVSGVLLNGDDAPHAARLLRRVEVFPSPLPVVTYSRRDPGRPATLALAGGGAHPVLGAMMRVSGEGRRGGLPGEAAASGGDRRPCLRE